MPEVTEDQKDHSKRWTAILQNDKENIFLGLIIVWATSILPVYMVSFVRWHYWCTVLFVTGRFLHTIGYAKCQKHVRVLGYVVSTVSVFVLSVKSLIVVYNPP